MLNENKRGTGYFFLARHSAHPLLSRLMPRIPRGQLAGHAYHVLNRGNDGAVIFHKDGDYAAFLALLQTAISKYPVRVLGFCLMPDHVHLVLHIATADALSPCMQ
jgi:putative transposase